MRNIEKSIAWIACAAVVAYAIYLTSNVWCLLGMLIPLCISERS